MRALMVFIVVMAALGYLQSVRNDCYWHGPRAALGWAWCLMKY